LIPSETKFAVCSAFGTNTTMIHQQHNVCNYTGLPMHV